MTSAQEAYFERLPQPEAPPGGLRRQARRYNLWRAITGDAAMRSRYAILRVYGPLHGQLLLAGRPVPTLAARPQRLARVLSRLQHLHERMQN